MKKKYQQVGGSVCEKIQTGPLKKKFLQKKLPMYKITYAYVLSKWFEDNCSHVIELLKNDFDIPISIVDGKHIDTKFIDELLK